MEIRLATDTDKNSWDAYVLQHSDGLAYQLFAWRQAVKKAYGYEAHYLLAEKDNNVCGVLPLVDFRIPFLGSALISLPYCDAGGVLADSDGIEQQLLDAALDLTKKTGMKCHIRSTQSLLIDRENTTDKVRMLLTLPENSELFLASIRSKLRNKINKPLKHGYRVEIGSSELIEAFYSIFAVNMHELGSPVHSRRWIEAIVSEYHEKVRIGVVFTPDGMPVAAGMILLHPTTISNPWASSLREYGHMKPNMLLYSTLLSFAADNGYKQFDFGRSSLGGGTYLFKEQWGAQPSKLYWYDDIGNVKQTYQPQSYSSDRTGCRSMAVRMWQQLPATGANWLGPRIRRYISL